MSEAEKPRFNVTADDLRNYDWQDRLEACNNKECDYFYGVLADGAKEQGAAADDTGEGVFSLLYIIASFPPNRVFKIDYFRFWLPRNIASSERGAASKTGNLHRLRS